MPIHCPMLFKKGVSQKTIKFRVRRNKQNEGCENDRKESRPGGTIRPNTCGVNLCRSDGYILYRNRTAANRPSPGPREKGKNIRDCHADPQSLKKIVKIFDDFKQGRSIPHHYVSRRTGIQELVTLVPIFQEDRFVGCLSVIHPLEIQGENRTFPRVLSNPEMINYFYR